MILKVFYLQRSDTIFFVRVNFLLRLLAAEVSVRAVVNAGEL